MTRRDDEIKQLVAEIRGLREELGNVKTEIVAIKRTLELAENQPILIKYRKWNPSQDVVD